MFDTLFAEIEQHLKDMIISYLMSVLQTMFDCVNDQVGTIASDVGTTPSAFNPTVFGMIRDQDAQGAAQLGVWVLHRDIEIAGAPCAAGIREAADAHQWKS